VANHYAILGVDRSASKRDVVGAYRRMALRHHPDAGGDSARFLEVQAAYEVLGDPGARARYDAVYAPRPAPAPHPPWPPRAQPAPAPASARRVTVPRPSLPAPSVGTCATAVALGLATFLVPAGAAFAVGGPIPIVLALVAALVLAKAGSGLAGTENERVRRHRQLWAYGFVLPELDDRERVDRCGKLAVAAERCCTFGLAGSVVVVILLAVLAQTSAP
jgi:curved DNA-binding protein CbpA